YILYSPIPCIIRGRHSDNVHDFYWHEHQWDFVVYLSPLLQGLQLGGTVAFHSCTSSAVLGTEKEGGFQYGRRSPQRAHPCNRIPLILIEFDENGGGGGIRTHGTVSCTPVFKTGALNRSATPPGN